MRHRIYGKLLGRNYDQRRSLIKNLCKSFLENGSITTTHAKAKACRSQIEKYISLILRDDLNSRRELFKIFQDRNKVESVFKSFNQSENKKLKSNFTRLEKINFRQGDNSLMVRLSLANPLVKTEVVKEVEKKKPKTTKVKKETK